MVNVRALSRRPRCTTLSHVQKSAALQLLAYRNLCSICMALYDMVQEPSIWGSDRTHCRPTAARTHHPRLLQPISSLARASEASSGYIRAKLLLWPSFTAPETALSSKDCMWRCP